MVQLISIILAFLIIYTLFKTRETSNSSRKLRMLVYTFLGIIFLLGLVSVVLGTYGLLNSYNISGNWRINMSSILVVLAGILLVVLSYVGISKFKNELLGELNEESYLYPFTSNPFCGIRLCGKRCS